jgi:hypothetical protein
MSENNESTVHTFWNLLNALVISVGLTYVYVVFGYIEGVFPVEFVVVATFVVGVGVLSVVGLVLEMHRTAIEEHQVPVEDLEAEYEMLGLEPSPVALSVLGEEEEDE